MEVHVADRRFSHRYPFKSALLVRVRKFGGPEQKAESENLSESGIFFATDAPLAVGSAVEILLKVPEEITGKPVTEWQYTGHVVRTEPGDSLRGMVGVGVQFDCYEVMRAKSPPFR